MTAKYKVVSRNFTGTQTGFSEPLAVQEGRAIHFSVVGTYVGQAQFQIRFSFSKDTDWRNLSDQAPAADAEVEDATFRAAVDCEVRVGLSAHTSGGVAVEGRISRERLR